MSFLKNVGHFYKKARLGIENELPCYYLLKYVSISKQLLLSQVLMVAYFYETYV